MWNNEQDTIFDDVKAMGKICGDKGILFHTDCVQALGETESINLEDIGCDFLSLSSHKIHGNKGVGALYVRDPSILSPVIFGGSEQEFGVRGGTENVASIVGFGEACEILKEEGEDALHHINSVSYEFIRSLYKEAEESNLDWRIKPNTDIMSTTVIPKIINLSIKDVDAETLVLMLDSKGVYVSAGSACRSHESEPSHVLTAMGIDPETARSSIRISFSRMNTTKEVVEASKIIIDSIATIIDMR